MSEGKRNVQRSELKTPGNSSKTFSMIKFLRGSGLHEKFDVIQMSKTWNGQRTNSGWKIFDGFQANWIRARLTKTLYFLVVQIKEI